MTVIKGGDEHFFTKFSYHEMPADWMQELYNHLVCGYPPGGFHTALFANDLHSAACKSHVANKWQWIVSTIKWLYEYAPDESFGNYELVKAWGKLTPEKRRERCEAKRLLLPEQEVIWNKMKDPG